MPTTVRKATAADSRAVYDLLRSSTLLNAGLPYAKRERLFRPNWGGTENHFGYVLEDEGGIRGFLGTLFTEREVAGTPRRFCELHSWYVQDDYRNEGIKLFLAAMSAKRVTILNHTPSAGVYEIGKKFGFTDLETHVLVIPPVPTLRGLRPDFRVESSPEVIAGRLTGTERRLFEDHRHIEECRHFLVTRRGSDTGLYLMVKRLWRRRWEPLGRILHLSDEKLFADAVDFLRLYLPVRMGLGYLIVDRGELAEPDAIRFTRTVDRPVPSQFKSRDLTADEVRTSLYTEPLLVGYRLH